MVAPKWLYADDVSSTRHFLIHTQVPRFLAEIFDGDEALAPLVLSLGDRGDLAVIDWHDPVPDDAALRKLAESARRFLADYDESTDIMTEDYDG